MYEYTRCILQIYLIEHPLEHLLGYHLESLIEYPEDPCLNKERQEDPAVW